jgi:hypothetical protein
MRTVLLVWIISAVFIAFMMNAMDGIVNGTLYQYGLQHSSAWAVPYQSFKSLIYVFLAIPAFLGGAALVLDFMGSAKPEVPEAKYVKSKAMTNEVKAPLHNGKENSMLINCPKCHKVFSKPMSMLDFSSGKARLVNVCPYCNHILGDANGKSPVDVHVADTEEEVVEDSADAHQRAN